MDKVTLGGQRLGSGKKMDVNLKTYNRSTHDLGYIWRSTMASGTLVPFMSKVALRGDTFDIDLECDIKTHPTIGPLFGSYKVQLDVFTCPIRLYKAELHNNMLNVGMNMKNITLPQLIMTGTQLNRLKNLDNQQINPSSLLAYLGIRGIGYVDGAPADNIREFNGVPFLAYWDIYKNYYANKQEEKGAYIHTETVELTAGITTVAVTTGSSPQKVIDKDDPIQSNASILYLGDENISIKIITTGGINVALTQVSLYTDMLRTGGFIWKIVRADELFTNIQRTGANEWTITGYKGWFPVSNADGTAVVSAWAYTKQANIMQGKPQIATFPLDNIDKMKERIFKSYGSTVIIADYEDPLVPDIAPYNNIIKRINDTTACRMFSQEGLALKTYQSDLFNNWLATEWIDGTNGINEITRVSTDGDSFSIDALNLAKKVYDMLNRVAVSGGSYDDWLEAVYPINKISHNEIPKYEGGLIRELVFQEVISTAENSAEGTLQPLGTLAGRGVMGQKKKGGKMVIRVDEPSYIIGIISLTPRVDYSQGNEWDVNLKNMDDFHKPALDEIGFQDLITDQMAWWDSYADPSGVPDFNSAGKQPAWINYMTSVNKTYGNFAIDDNEMFMTLNRRYEYNGETADRVPKIKDLTTYIDPSKFNNIFAETAIDAQNFWAQIGVDITARRLMSAKVIPNL